MQSLLDGNETQAVCMAVSSADCIEGEVLWSAHIQVERYILYH
jgi:hypothetical protein